MSHNKMYREIPGYEDALYATTDSMDKLEDLYDLIQYGESKIKIAGKIDEAQQKLARIKNNLLGKEFELTNIYTVYFYYSQWSDSYEEDRLYFTSFDKAKKHEEYLKEKNQDLINEDEDFGVIFEQIKVVSETPTMQIDEHIAVLANAGYYIDFEIGYDHEYDCFIRDEFHQECILISVSGSGKTLSESFENAVLKLGEKIE